MKRAIHISRVAACVAVSLYTVFSCYLCGEMAYHFCLKILTDGNGGYYMAPAGMTREAVPHTVAAVVLLLLGVVSVVFLFQRGRLAVCLSGAAAVIAAILGICTDTMLVEVMFARDTLGLNRLGLDVDAWLAIKPAVACICICAAVIHMILRLIASRQQRQSIADQTVNCSN